MMNFLPLAAGYALRSPWVCDERRCNLTKLFHSVGLLSFKNSVLKNPYMEGPGFEIASADQEARLFPPLERTEDCLRILTLQPGSDARGFWSWLDDEIVCTTEVYKFSDLPDRGYRALSYTWGDATPSKPISLNGLRFKIPENTWSALYHLRHPINPQHLWVDSICINMTSPEEKLRQIPLMNKIYRRASEVLVWLGPSTLPSSTLRELKSWAAQPLHFGREYTETWWSETVDWLSAVTRQHYWRRTWIIQEVYAAISIRVCFGRQSMPWDTFIQIVNAYRRCFLQSPWIDDMYRLEHLRHQKSTAQVSSLAELVSEFRDSFCTIPRDKIYAFMSMSSDGGESGIRAEYDTSDVKVYTDYIRYLSNAIIDSHERRIDLVYSSALIRHLLTRVSSKQLRHDRLPVRTGMRDEPYEVDRFFTSEDGKLNVREETRYGRIWHEWVLHESPIMVNAWTVSENENPGLWLIQESEHERTNTVSAVGRILGRIQLLGPTIEEVLGSETSSADWKRAIIAHITPKQVKQYLALYERAVDVLSQKKGKQAANLIAAFGAEDYQEQSSQTAFKSAGRLFVGTSGLVGVTGKGVRSGDLLIQFWNTNRCAVVRGDDDASRIVGRAAIVDIENDRNWAVEKTRDYFQLDQPDVKELALTLNELTMLSLNLIA